MTWLILLLDENESKLREFYCELAREGNDEDMPSQESTTSELTPLTPEVVTGKYPPLTANERTIAETKIRAAGQEGLLVPGLTSRVAYSLPNLNRDYGLFVTLPLNTRSRARFICAAEPSKLFLSITFIHNNKIIQLLCV